MRRSCDAAAAGESDSDDDDVHDDVDESRDPRALAAAGAAVAGAAAAGARGAEDERRVTACVDSLLESVVMLQRACSAERSEGMLVALGAQITISEFVAGRTAQRLSAACRWLRSWCESASRGACYPPCFVFLLTSWLEAKEVDGNSECVPLSPPPGPLASDWLPCCPAALRSCHSPRSGARDLPAQLALVPDRQGRRQPARLPLTAPRPAARAAERRRRRLRLAGELPRH